MEFTTSRSSVPVYDSDGFYLGLLYVGYSGAYSITESDSKRTFSLNSLSIMVNGWEVDTTGNGFSAYIDVNVYQKSKDGEEIQVNGQTFCFSESSYIVTKGSAYPIQRVYESTIDQIDFSVDGQSNYDLIVKIQPHITGVWYPLGTTDLYPFQDGSGKNLNYLGSIWEYKLTMIGGPLAPIITNVVYPSATSPTTCSITWKQDETTGPNISVPETTVIKRYEEADPTNTEVTIWRYAINGYNQTVFPTIDATQTGDGIINEYQPVDSWKDFTDYPRTIVDNTLEPNKAYRYVIRSGNTISTAERITDSIIYTAPEDAIFDVTLYSKAGAVYPTTPIGSYVIQYKINNDEEWQDAETLNDIKKNNAKDIVSVRIKNKIIQGDGITEIYSTNWSNSVTAHNIYIPFINVDYNYPVMPV